LTASRLVVAAVVAVIVAACASSRPDESARTRQSSASAALITQTPDAHAEPHVMVIVEENRGYAATLGSCSADPYLCSLAAGYASLTD
jgi:hypothetical protein